MINYSKRVINMQASPIRKLTPLADEAKNKGKKIYHLNIGQPDIETPDLFFNAIKEYNVDVLKYEDSRGMNSTINSFIKYYEKHGIYLDKENIIITNGGSEALLFSILSLCDIGDNIIIPEPFYANYSMFSSIAGVEVIPIITKPEDGFHLPSYEKLESYINANTKAILFSNPGNPTGIVYTKDELMTICKIAKEHNIFIIADEVYREFIYDDLKFTSIMEFDEISDRVILIDSISKRYSACGARIGCIISKNKSLMKYILKLAQSRLCISSIDQVGAAALINTSEEYFNNVVLEYEKRRNIVYEGLSKIKGVKCTKPSGAFYIMAVLPVDSAEEFVKFLLSDFSIDNETVMLAPGDGFYSTEGLGKNEIRISYCLKCEDLKKAINIIEKGLEQYNK